MEMKLWFQKASLSALLQWRMLFPGQVQIEVFTMRIVFVTQSQRFELIGSTIFTKRTMDMAPCQITLRSY